MTDFQNLENAVPSIIGPIHGGLMLGSFEQKITINFSIGVELLLISFFLAAFYFIKPFLVESTD
jgi:hypothetical protein